MRAARSIQRNALLAALPDAAQELIANMLGVPREGVTEAAGKLQNRASSTTTAEESP